MYWKASAMLWMKSSWRMAVMEGLSMLLRQQQRTGHDPVGPGHGQGRDEEGDVDRHLPEYGLVRDVFCIDEGLQQVDRGDADDGGGQLDLEHAGVDVGKAFGVIGEGS